MRGCARGKKRFRRDCNRYGLLASGLSVRLCRQTLAEFNPDIRLVLSSINGETIVSSLKKIHKNHFDGASLRRK
jgi:hypothetical protein